MVDDFGRHAFVSANISQPFFTPSDLLCDQFLGDYFRRLGVSYSVAGSSRAKEPILAQTTT